MTVVDTPIRHLRLAEPPAEQPSADQLAAAPPAARPPSVLYVLKRYPRLSETFVVREILGLEATGAQVGIDALSLPEDGPVHDDVHRVRAAVRFVPRRRLRHGPVLAAHARVARRRPLTWARRAWSAQRDGRWRRFVQAGVVADRVQAGGFEIVHAHFATAAAEVAQDAAALSGRPFTVTAHAKDVFHHDNAPRLAGRVAGAAAVVTVSHHNVAHLRGALPGAVVEHVPNGLPIPEAVGPRDGGPVVCVARLVPKKGIDLLVRAVALMHEPRPLVIVGDGPCRAELESLAGELGIADRVTFPGALAGPDVDAWYRQAAVFALPCRVDASGDRDGMPTVLVEAMGRALPVVSTDVVGIGELVIDGVTGRLVAPEDPGALAGALDDLVADHPSAVTLGLAARTAVCDGFHPSVATAALVRVFERAVGR